MSKSRLGELTEKKVVCPHCWHNFYAAEAMYVSSHPKSEQDQVVAGKVRLAPHEVQKDRDGTVRDKHGSKIFDRACPICHLHVPADLLLDRPTFISIAGAPGAGKSYFLTSMLHGLRTELPDNFGLLLKESESEEIETFIKEYEDKLFSPKNPAAFVVLEKTHEAAGGIWYNTVQLAGQNIQLPKPFVFSIASTDAHLASRQFGKRLRQSIVLYDNAGESYFSAERRKSTSRVTEHLAECDAVLFAFDPLQDATVRSRLKAETPFIQATEAAETHRQDTVLTEVVNRIRRHNGGRDRKRLDLPLAVCVQKYDVWKSLVMKARIGAVEKDIIDKNSIYFNQEKGVGGLDIVEINAISLLVRQFLVEHVPQLVAIAEAEFSIVRYFPVSALGTSPYYDEAEGQKAELDGQKRNPGYNLVIRVSEIKPFRATHPFLWLLYRSGFIYRKIPKSTGEDEHPHARVKQTAVGDRIEITFPTSPRSATIIVDSQYAGCTVVDPISGKLFWIPSVEHPASEKKSQAPSAGTTAGTKVHSPPTAPGLTLTETPQPKKRRWFRSSE